MPRSDAHNFHSLASAYSSSQILRELENRWLKVLSTSIQVTDTDLLNSHWLHLTVTARCCKSLLWKNCFFLLAIEVQSVHIISPKILGKRIAPIYMKTKCIPPPSRSSLPTPACHCPVLSNCPIQLPPHPLSHSNFSIGLTCSGGSSHCHASSLCCHKALYRASVAASGSRTHIPLRNWSTAWSTTVELVPVHSSSSIGP